MIIIDYILSIIDKIEVGLNYQITNYWYKVNKLFDSDEEIIDYIEELKEDYYIVSYVNNEFFLYSK